ncbi:MAG: hypothetical protein N3C12_11215 [Candidatus Binatia bacterium]|nr:hypothetical protein [Candidatus Binatia bacterium]
MLRRGQIHPARAGLLDLVRGKPEPLSVPQAINEVWSMDFMHDQLQDGRSIRLHIDLCRIGMANKMGATHASILIEFGRVRKGPP